MRERLLSYQRGASKCLGVLCFLHLFACINSLPISPHAQSEDSKKLRVPNEKQGGSLILITINDLSTQHISQENAHEAMPYLKKLGERGWRFEQHYGVSHPKLAPYQSMMTSLYPHDLNADGRPSTNEHRHFVRELKKQGYATALVQQGPQSPVANLRHYDLFATRLGQNPEALVERALELHQELALLRPGQSRFLWLSFQDIKPRPPALRKLAVKNRTAHLAIKNAAIDRALKTLVQTLEAEDQLELLVLTAEHSPNKKPVGRPVKKEVGLPLIFYGEGQSFARRITQSPTQSVDVVPTVLHILGLKHWEPMRGKNQAKVPTADITAPPELQKPAALSIRSP